MRLADTLMRGGHLSERALVDVYMTGDRPAHLDRCEPCANRAIDLGRWLDEIRAAGLQEADAVFPPERLALQQGQILRKLEQIDRPKRVLSFPSYAALNEHERLPLVRRGIRPAWVGFAAAAGLVLGLIGGQFSAQFTAEGPATPVTPVQVQQPPVAPLSTPSNAENTFNPLDLDVADRPMIASAEAWDAYTPHALPTAIDYVIPTVSRTR